MDFADYPDHAITRSFGSAYYSAHAEGRIATDEVPLWSVARLLRIAPVNREMILNYVAGHSLSLPRSYGS